MCIVDCMLRYSVISRVMYGALSMYPRRFIHTVYLNEHIWSSTEVELVTQELNMLDKTPLRFKRQQKGL